MKNGTLLSKLVEKIELEILTTEESALIGGSADSILAGNNCKCNGDNCDCNTGGNNCQCNGNNCPCKVDIPAPGPEIPPTPDPVVS